MRLRHVLVPVCLFAVVAATLDAAPPRRSRDRAKIVTKTTFDPEARKVEFFEAQDAETIEVKLIARDSKGGNVYVKNTTDETLNVALPESFVGMPVLKQFGQFPGAGGGVGGGLPGGGLGGGQGGGAQPVGGGLGGGGLGGGGLGGPGLGGGGALGGGGNFFSIPPETTARIPYTSVCLAHGKKEPRPNNQYRVVRVEEVSNDASLNELLKLVGTGRINQRAAQATAWHLVDRMSWRQLAAKRQESLTLGQATPYFNLAELQLGQQLLVVARQRAAAAKDENDDAPEAPARAVRSTRRP